MFCRLDGSTPVFYNDAHHFRGRMQIIHIVRRYGPVGGMERYVWETTRELTKLGHQVQVLCERCVVEKPKKIL